MAALYTYVVRFDSGFAPNPFFGFCTLATCKTQIRKYAKIGDWIVGTGSKSVNRSGYLVYAMKVTEVLSFQEYSSDSRFEKKKPSLHGSYKTAAGDNIYSLTEAPGYWHQLDSYHSNTDGTSNDKHIQRDTNVNRVLISRTPNFIYFGAEGPPVRESFSGVDVVYSGRGQKKITDPVVVIEFSNWIDSLGVKGYQGKPYDMKKEMKTKK